MVATQLATELVTQAAEQVAEQLLPAAQEAICEVAYALITTANNNPLSTASLIAYSIFEFASACNRKLPEPGQAFDLGRFYRGVDEAQFYLNPKGQIMDLEFNPNSNSTDNKEFFYSTTQVSALVKKCLDKNGKNASIGHGKSISVTRSRQAPYNVGYLNQETPDSCLNLIESNSSFNLTTIASQAAKSILNFAGYNCNISETSQTKTKDWASSIQDEKATKKGKGY